MKNKKYYCKICGNKIGYVSALYRKSLCQPCSQKERHKNPENSARFIDGRTLQKYFCIICGVEISYSSGYCGSKMCGSCSCKERLSISENNPNFKDGFYSKTKKYFCIDCGKEVRAGSTRCKLCCAVYISKTYCGDMSWNWKGGLSLLKYSNSFNKKFKEQIKIRDNHTSLCCNMTEEEHLKKFNQVLHVHHIDYNKQNCKEYNCITLCKSCHHKTNHNREYWQYYFTNLLQELYYDYNFISTSGGF